MLRVLDNMSNNLGVSSSKTSKVLTEDMLGKKNTSKFKQTNPNFNISGKVKNAVRLYKAYRNLQAMIVKKTENTLWNWIKNLLISGRKRALEEIKNQLKIPETLTKKFFRNKATMNGLSSEVKEALEDLRDSIFEHHLMEKSKERYSMKELKEMFSMLFTKKEPIGQGSFGRVWGNKKLVFKLIEHDTNSVALQEVNANKGILEGKKGFMANKEVIYREFEDFFTEYIGSFNDSEDNDVLVFERVNGCDMFEYMYPQKESIVQSYKKRIEKSNVKFCTDCTIFARLAEGIAALHETGCVNRDIKPENVMLGFRNGSDVVEDSFL